METDTHISAEDYLHLKIGQAISTWSWVEYHLVSHFEHALSISRRRAVHILEPVINFSLRIQIIDAANKDILTGHVSEEYWSSLIEFVKELSGDRNMLAHYPVQTPFSAQHLETEPIPYVGPTDPEYSARQAKRQTLPLDEVENLVGDFEEAAILLADFSRWRYSNLPCPERFCKAVKRLRPNRSARLANQKSGSAH